MGEPTPFRYGRLSGMGGSGRAQWGAAHCRAVPRTDFAGPSLSSEVRATENSALMNAQICEPSTKATTYFGRFVYKLAGMIEVAWGAKPSKWAHWCY
ncbi:hypothetical protein BD311DRAFT_133437 [Dichomitus squalens]|uniref:Uncharacterized protein n=1 Tax=Dichomitus squalens TaxID=114155 RepID=A0A4Q9MXG1_9APHY|nr:hypothetical protein BD311DRAFT_133437 [Dichomitus squalens]